MQGLLKVDVGLPVVLDGLVGLGAPVWVLRDLLQTQVVQQEVHARLGASHREPRVGELCVHRQGKG